MGKLFTSESVTFGHPDKLADLISDTVLDAYLTIDPDARVAIETLITNNIVIVAGEVTATIFVNEVDLRQSIRSKIRSIGYNDPKLGFCADSFEIFFYLQEQSKNIADGIMHDGVIAAGDQGLITGYASDETPELMPLAYVLARRLTDACQKAFKHKTLAWIKPDGKSQVTMEYDDDGNPQRIHTVVVSIQQSDVDLSVVRNDVVQHIIKPVCGKWLDKDTIIHVNPAGKFIIGGPIGDTGVTGRKNIVDTYGGFARHGGGALSGKDPSKVDRSAAYAARYIAKNLVAAKVCKTIEVQLGYVIGLSGPISINVEITGANKVFRTNLNMSLKTMEDRIVDCIYAIFPITVSDIVNHFDLKRPIYSKPTFAFGHLLVEASDNCLWEQTDKINEIKNYFAFNNQDDL